MQEFSRLFEVADFSAKYDFAIAWHIRCCIILNPSTTGERFVPTLVRRLQQSAQRTTGAISSRVERSANFFPATSGARYR